MFKKKDEQKQATPPQNPKISIDHLTELGEIDMQDLCESAEAAIKDGGGFGWIKMPSRDVMERYWRGVILVPHRDLFVGRVDGTIAGTIQLIRQPSHNEAQAFSAKMISLFVSPWARRFGIAQDMVKAVEKFAKKKGIDVVRLDVRETQEDAIELFKSLDYEHWGTNPRYAKVKGKLYQGFYFQKDLSKTRRKASILQKTEKE